MQESFLQSAEWEAFQKRVGRSVWRVEDALILRHGLSGGLSYLYCPRPALRQREKAFLAAAQQLAADQKSVFLKIDSAEPLEIAGTNNRNRARNVWQSWALQPTKTIIIDLKKSEDELLGAMREKTRYNIRLAQRKGVQVVTVLRKKTDADAAVFWEMLSQTAQRNKFRTHPRSYYEMLLSQRSERFSNELFFAQYEGSVLAAAMVNFYTPTSTATYLHGASVRTHKEVMAPYALHWHIVREARLRGVGSYDLWGIDEKRWPGLTRFKSGFGGAVLDYPPSFDIAYQPFWYGLYRARHVLRGR